MKLHRFAAAVVAIALIVAVSAGAGLAQRAEPIRVGVLLPMTGVFAAGGADAHEAVRLAFEGIDYEINGRPIQLFFEDSQANPTAAVQRASRLVEREGVQLILGPLSGSAGEAIKEYADRIPHVTVIVAGAAAENITMRGIKDNVFRTTYTGAQVMFPFGKFVHDELGYKRVATLAEDYAFPYSQVGGFVSSFILAGGEVPRRIWVPLGTSDYSSVIPQIPNDVDALLVALGGTDAINFLRQARDFGLLDRMNILGGTIMVDPTVLQAAGDLVEGVYTGSHYAQELPYPEFEAFNSAFRERTGRTASLFGADYYIAAQVAIEALKAVDGRIEDQQAFRNALRAVRINTPRGPFRFDEYQQAVLTVYITQVRFVDGEYKNVVIHTYPDSTQFGPFDPEQYQAQPPFDRTNPTVETIRNMKLRQQ